MSTEPSHQPFQTSLKILVSSSLFQGLASLAGLIAALATDNPWVRIPALIVLFGFLFALRLVIWHGFRSIIRWLTWKFALGLSVGIIAGASLFPMLENAFLSGIAFFSPDIEVIETNPPNGGTLRDLASSVDIRFSERIPQHYLNSFYIRVEITPDYPIELTWIYDYDIDTCC